MSNIVLTVRFLGKFPLGHSGSSFKTMLDGIQVPSCLNVIATGKSLRKINPSKQDLDFVNS